jgi:hypothetical protein
MSWDKNPFKSASEGNGSNKPHFVLVRSKNVKLDNSPCYLVDGLIPKDSLVLVWGPPKCGKTFWVFDLTMHIALGWEYRGRLVEAGTIVYVACEGERGLAARNAAFRQDKLSPDDDPPFYLVTTRLDLPDEVDTLILDIAAQIPKDAEGNTYCAAIVLDTLNRSLGGSESRDEDMAAYIAAADALREKFHCAVIIIHHCGLNENRPRGHTSLTGAADAQLAVSRNGDEKVITKVEYMKDGEDGEQIASTLRVVEVARDTNDQVITSLVVDPADAPLPKQRSKAKPADTPNLPDTQIIALAALRKGLAEFGLPASLDPDIPRDAVVITEETWRRNYMSSTSSTDHKSEDTRSKAWRRARNALIAKEIVKMRNGSIWLANSSGHSQNVR